jgi:REP element-mobilizing transposase RayT
MQLARDAAYHVLSRGHNRGILVADAADLREFLTLLQRYRQRFDFHLYHHCLMTNHFHLLLQLEESRRLSSLLAGLLLAYAHHCRRHGLVGRLYQGRFKSIPIHEEHLQTVRRYVKRNALRAGLV